MRFSASLAAVASLAVASSQASGARTTVTVASADEQCQPALVMVDRSGLIWFGNEPHERSVLLVALCRRDLPAASADAKKALSTWLQENQEKYSGRPESKLRICGMDMVSAAPTDELLGEARKRLPGVMDWCWVLGQVQMP